VVAALAAHSSSLGVQHLLTLALGLVVGPPVARIVAANRMAVITLAELSEHDPLTGLMNRRGLDRRLGRTGTDRRGGVGVIYLDVDGFQAINDEYGHDVGDEFLAQLGRRVAAAVRSTDLAVRVGGDEFVVVCEGDEAVIDRIRERVCRLTSDEPYLLDGKLLSVRVSAGFSHADTLDADVDALIAEADEAMYLAKRSGGGIRGDSSAGMQPPVAQ
jgi:chemotaxis family two-component system sensor kinase Cph1